MNKNTALCTNFHSDYKIILKQSVLSFTLKKLLFSYNAYKIHCSSYPKFYMGQTGITFEQRISKHKRKNRMNLVTPNTY